MTTPAEGTAHRRVVIANRRGLHARAAAKFVKLAETFSADITVATPANAKGQSVSGLSIMGLMMLAASPGMEIDISATGDQATEAVAALAGLVEGKFEED
jgi:phosphocarrier protein